MRREENDCVGCLLPCLGRYCPYRCVEHIYCDNCGEEIHEDTMFTEFNEEYCLACASELGLIEEDEEYDV